MPPQASLTAAIQAAGRAVGTSPTEVAYDESDGESSRLEVDAQNYDGRHDVDVH